MPIRSTAFTLAFLLALGAIPALAQHESPEEHAKHETRTVTLDGTDIRPTTLTMDHADALAFVNYSTHPLEVTFTEPADLKDKIRCGLVKGREEKAPAPWALFTWQHGKLVGNVPPGRFASVCSLDPGQYAFTVTAVAENLRSRDGSAILPSKGRIEVK